MVERPVDKTELFIADEVFLTGTAAKITPISKIESTIMNDHRPIMDSLKKKLVSITEGREEQYNHWISKVSI